MKTEQQIDTTKDYLRAMVDNIAATLTNGFDDMLNQDDEPMSASDYVFEALDVEYTVSSKKEYLGATLCVAFGGPSVYIDTRKQLVEGYWWGDRYSTEYTDNVGLDDAARDIFECQ